MLIKTTKTAPVARRPEPGPTSGPVEDNPASGGGTGRTVPGSAGAPRGVSRGFWVVMLLAIVTLVTVVTVTISADREPGQDATTVTAVPGPTVGTQEFLNRLADQGYIPREAVDRRRLLLERAVERGHIPAATLGEPIGSTG